MPDLIYNSFKRSLLNDDIRLLVDAIRVALVTSTYVPDADTHTNFTHVTNEVTGTGYTAGGFLLASKTVTVDNTDNEGVFDAADVTWATSTITARGAVLYMSTGTAATSLLICYLDFVTNQISTAGDFTIAWNAEGIINLN